MRLHIHNLHNQYIARLGRFNLKGTREVMNSGEIDISHIVGAVIVADSVTKRGNQYASIGNLEMRAKTGCAYTYCPPVQSTYDSNMISGLGFLN